MVGGFEWWLWLWPTLYWCLKELEWYLSLERECDFSTFDPLLKMKRLKIKIHLLNYMNMYMYMYMCITTLYMYMYD